MHVCTVIYMFACVYARVCVCVCVDKLLDIYVCTYICKYVLFSKCVGWASQLLKMSVADFNNNNGEYNNITPAVTAKRQQKQKQQL